MLVSALTGVFDPPPTVLSVPWIYLAATGGAIIVALTAVSAMTIRVAQRSPVSVLNEL
jgi:putative ABC transport system permease protein